MFLKKFRVSITKLILPLLYLILKPLKADTRIVNFFNEKRINANKLYNFHKILDSLLGENKLIGLDVGAEGGFNSDNFFPKKYNKYFESILVDPFKTFSKEYKSKHIINKGFWSSRVKKNLFILNKRPQSSSMYKPEIKSLPIYGFKEKDFELFKVSETVAVECDTLSESLKELNINQLDYLKIDTQGSELEILKGIGDFRPLMIKCEVQIFPMYKNQPSWTEITDYLYKLGYIICDWKKIGSNVTRTPVEMDMIFVPNFLQDFGKKLIIKNEKEFICLMLITGQIDLLKKISKLLDFKNKEFFMKTEDKYFN